MSAQDAMARAAALGMGDAEDAIMPYWYEAMGHALAALRDAGYYVGKVEHAGRLLERPDLAKNGIVGVLYLVSRTSLSVSPFPRLPPEES